MRYALPILLFPLLAACSAPAEETPQVEFVEEVHCAHVAPPLEVQPATTGLWSAETDPDSRPYSTILSPFGASVSSGFSVVEDAVDEVHEDPSDKPNFDLDVGSARDRAARLGAS